MPASRSTTPSSTRATATSAAPASSAARATAMAPCPYPSAFTTAQTAAGAATRRTTSTFERMAPRSTSAHAGRNRGLPVTVSWTLLVAERVFVVPSGDQKGPRKLPAGGARRSPHPAAQEPRQEIEEVGRDEP